MCRSGIIMFYFKEKFCVSHASASRSWDVYCLKPLIRPGRKNYISGHISHKSFIQMVKSSFFKQIIDNQSFYGAPLTFSYFLLQEKVLYFGTRRHLRDTYLQVTLSKKVYLRLYLTQIVHSNGKMLFLAPNSCASLTFFKEKLCVSARVSKSLCLDHVYLCRKNVIFRLCLLHEDGIEACIPGSIWQKNSKFLIEWQK